MGGDPQIYSHLCLNRQITKSTFGWLRSLRERMKLKEKRGQARALGSQTWKRQRQAIQDGASRVCLRITRGACHSTDLGPPHAQRFWFSRSGVGLRIAFPTCSHPGLIPLVCRPCFGWQWNRLGWEGKGGDGCRVGFEVSGDVRTLGMFVGWGEGCGRDRERLDILESKGMIKEGNSRMRKEEGSKEDGSTSHDGPSKNVYGPWCPL